MKKKLPIFIFTLLLVIACPPPDFSMTLKNIYINGELINISGPSGKSPFQYSGNINLDQGKEVEIYVDAFDSSGKPPEIKWNCENGTYDSIQGDRVTYRPPDSESDRVSIEIIGAGGADSIKVDVAVDVLPLAENSITITAAKGGGCNPEGIQIVELGTPLSIEALPEADYQFLEWRIERGAENLSISSRGDSEITATLLKESAALKAFFIKNQCSLAFETDLKGGTGRIEYNGPNSLNGGDILEVSALIGTDSAFGGWTISPPDSGTIFNPLQETTTIQIVGDATITAHFVASLHEAVNGLSASRLIYGDKIELTWDAVEGADNYLVYRGDSLRDDSFVNLGSTSSNVFMDNTVSRRDTPYYYKVYWQAGGVTYGYDINAVFGICSSSVDYYEDNNFQNEASLYNSNFSTPLCYKFNDSGQSYEDPDWYFYDGPHELVTVDVALETDSQFSSGDLSFQFFYDNQPYGPVGTIYKGVSNQFYFDDFKEISSEEEEYLYFRIFPSSGCPDNVIDRYSLTVSHGY